MKTLRERVRIALDLSSKKQVELARACGVNPASVNDWLSGKTQSLKSSTALRAAAFLGVNQLWLAEGKGEMKGAGVPVIPSPQELQQPPVASIDVIENAVAGVLEAFGLHFDDLVADKRAARKRILLALESKARNAPQRSRFHLGGDDAKLPPSRATRARSKTRFPSEVPPEKQHEEGVETGKERRV